MARRSHFRIAMQSPDGQLFPNPAGTLGTPLAGAPPFEGNVRVRYEFPWNGYDAFVQSTAVHQSHSLATTNCAHARCAGQLDRL